MEEYLSDDKLISVVQKGKKRAIDKQAQLDNLIKAAETKAIRKMSSAILNAAKKHNVDDYDSEYNWLCRCISDAQQQAK